MPASAATSKAVDELMERASRALTETDYFKTEELCLKAMARARAVNDFGRMARICMPLQEARRQRREQALDSGCVVVLDDLPDRRHPPEPGCYLLMPPLIGVDGKSFRELAERRRVPVFVLVREPTAQSGRWPIVGVGGGERLPVVVRVQVDPPRDNTPDAAWFVGAQEKLGDAAMLKVRRDWPADHRVDDLLELLEAVPDHEKLSQLLEATCREAVTLPLTDRPRRRPTSDDPFSF
jgi:hypothetical protein